MEPADIQIPRNRLKATVFSFLSLILLVGFASEAEAAYSLPADRTVAWQGNVGVQGDIPSRSVICRTLRPSGDNDSAAINAAISACPAGQVVQLGPGTFYINDHINVKAGISLRGSGMGVTRLQGKTAIRGRYIVGINGGPYYSTSYAVTAGLTKGSTIVTTGSATGWSVGDIVLIDQLNDANGAYGPAVSSIGTNGPPGETWASRNSGSRVAGQVNRIVSISGTVITLENPLYWDFHSALTPQITKINGIKTMAGIEDLTVDNQTSRTDGIVINGTANCWLKGVELNGSWQNGILLKKSYRVTIRSCKIHEGIPPLPEAGPQYSTSRAYGIFSNITSASLIENNQFYHLCMTVCMSGPNSGNVLSYNYIAEMYYSPSMKWQSDIFSLHGGHARANLFEGNWGVGSFLADNVWGSSSHNVLFRNRITLDPKRPRRAFDIGLYSMSSYFSIVGNVLGSTGFETSYSTSTSGTKSILGLDPAIAASTLIHANWDSVTNGVRWNGTDDHVLPCSLYLSSKPSWWGSLHWPAIGPDVSPMYPAAPVVGSGTPWGANKFIPTHSGKHMLSILSRAT